MSVRRRKETRQQEFWVTTESLPEVPRHVFYEKLNEVLAEGGFDEFVEELCERYYKAGGRPGIPPGVYFRMLFIGFFECLTGQRAIAWRCADSLSLKTFLGYGLCEQTPDHSSLYEDSLLVKSIHRSFSSTAAASTCTPDHHPRISRKSPHITTWHHEFIPKPAPSPKTNDLRPKININCRKRV